VSGTSRDSTEDDDGDRQSGSRARPAQPGVQLTLLFESGRPLAATCFDLAAVDAVTVGRRAEKFTAELTATGGERRLGLKLQDRRVSQVHLHMRRTSQGWSLEGAGSRNGSRVNGRRVAQHLLRTGDLVEVGQSFLLFRESEGAPPAIGGNRRLGMVTASPSLGRTLDELATLAPARVPILILGETGTGKELVAKAIHQHSGRKGPFVTVNCGALPRSLVESELFGYRKGSFSGAQEDRIGLIRAAHTGTLFLDEIGDLALDAQTALLRVLQEGEVHPLGATTPIPVDVRVVAATHRRLPDMVAAREFREDLFARLNGFMAFILPLRERREDFGTLVRHLLERHAPDRADGITFDSGAVRRLCGYGWPANVRELEKVIQKSVLLAASDTIDQRHMPGLPGSGADAPGWVGTAPPRRDRSELALLLDRHHGNVTAVAAELKTSRMQVHRLCRRLQIDLRKYRQLAD
jgi:transcriptional regulator with AAA-type ATPase domain